MNLLCDSNGRRNSSSLHTRGGGEGRGAAGGALLQKLLVQLRLRPGAEVAPPVAALRGVPL